MTEEQKDKISRGLLSFLNAHPDVKVGWHKMRDGALRHSDGSKQKMRLAHLGKMRAPHREETKKKISASLLGHSTSESTKQRIALGNKQTKSLEGFKTRQSEALKGNSNHKGHYHTEETKRIVALHSKVNWQSPSYIQKQMKARKTYPNKAEIFLTDKIQGWFPGEYKYNGCPGQDGGMVLAGKVPDWVNVNGQKKIIELFGEPFHAPEEEQQRKELFKSYGWDTLVIWGKELGNMRVLKEKVIKFNEARKKEVI